MPTYTILSSQYCTVEQFIAATADTPEHVEKVDGTEVQVSFAFDIDGESKTETQTYRFPTQDAEEVKAKLSEALTSISSSSAPTTEDVVEVEVEGLEVGTTETVE